MGDWDFYCAICGGPLCKPYWRPPGLEETAAAIARHDKARAREGNGEAREEDDDDDRSGHCTNYTDYDPRVLPSDRDDKLNWLNQFRVVSETPEEYGKDVPEAWISGPASMSNYGSADVIFPDLEGPLAGTVKDMMMYEPIALSDPLAIPFHDQCRDLLLKRTGEVELDAEAFYETVCALSGGSHCLGKLHYGEIAHQMEQYWVTEWGREWLVMAPLDIPGLHQYYNNLPKIDHGSLAQTRHIELRSAVNDPFSRFPFEILEQIMGELSLASIRKLRLASRAVCNQELTNGFWKKRVRRDMGFLFDMPDAARNATDVDWRRVYREISIWSNPKRRKAVRGLANRARIWKQTLPQIAEPYMRNLAAKQRARASEPSVFKGAKNEGLASLVLPEPKDARTTNVAFMSMPHLIHRAKLELVISFNHFDEIADLDAINHAESTLAESRKTFTGRVEKVRIPDDSWVTGIIVTTATREAKDSMATRVLRRVVGLEILLTKRGASVKVGCQRGDKKVIHVPEGDFIVGLKVRQSADSSVLCRLGLFCHQSWRAGSNNYRQRNKNDDKYSLVQDRMWHHELPRQGPVSGEGPAPGAPYCGYWDSGLVGDIEPMQHLIWDAEGYHQPSHITSISADVLFGGFRVTYDNQPDRTIGPCLNAMKTLTIDAAGGEGILSMHFRIDHIVTSIRFVTTRNRQLVIGQPHGREERFPTRGSPNKPLPGFFAHWSRSGSPLPNLKAIGGFHSPSNWLETDVSPEASQQVSGPYWEPTELAEGLARSGPCIGAFLFHAGKMGPRDKSVPDECAVRAWLDCSQAIASVRTTLCHTAEPHALPLVGVTLTMADGSTASVGPDTFPSAPEDCWCSLGISVKEEKEARPHYLHDTWNVGGQHLAKLRVWLWALSTAGQGHRIAAVSWVAADGSESPRYGHWGHTGEGEEIHEIEFGDGKAVGLLCFVGFNGRQVTRDDCTVQAVQALVRCD